MIINRRLICFKSKNLIIELKVEQSKIYKYKNLAGGVFEITNPTKNPITLDVSIFAKSFDNVKSFYPNLSIIEPKKTITVLVVQKLAGK